jgi:DNA-binding CsgD family transcriptional regulator
MEKEIIREYLTGKSTRACAKIFKVSQFKIRSVLKKNNIKTRGLKESRGITDEIEIQICVEYQVNKKTSDIANRFGIDSSTVRDIVRRNGLKVRSISESVRKYNFDYSFFEKIDSEEKAYYLGFIVADGCIHKNTLAITIQEQDSYILDKLKSILKFDGILYNINYKKKSDKFSNQRGINLISNKLVSDLEKYGVVSKKSHKTKFPNIPESLQNHFIRGVFDGDGCVNISDKTLNINIVGNRELIEEIQKILIKNCVLNKTKFGKSKSENIVYVRYGGNLQCKKIFDYLYKDSNIFLQRKYDKFISVLCK